MNRQTEKWITAGLGLVAVILVANMVFRGNRRPDATQVAAPARGPASPSQGVAADRQSAELTRYDPALRMDAFNEIQKRPPATVKRNPFEFVPREVAAAPAPAPTGSAPAPQAPAAPPPPPLKAVGYTQSAAGADEAFVTLQDELFIVHEGDTFAKRFRVQRLSPAAVEVLDETTQQIIRLPIGG